MPNVAHCSVLFTLRLALLLVLTKTVPQVFVVGWSSSTHTRTPDPSLCNFMCSMLISSFVLQPDSDFSGIKKCELQEESG